MRLHRRLIISAALIATVTAVAGPASPAAADTYRLTSSVYAGYSMRVTDINLDPTIDRAQGGFLVPNVTCAKGSNTSAAAWVGFGALGPGAHATPHIGVLFRCVGGKPFLDAFEQFSDTAVVSNAITLDGKNGTPNIPINVGAQVEFVLDRTGDPDTFAATVGVAADGYVPDMQSTFFTLHRVRRSTSPVAYDVECFVERAAVNGQLPPLTNFASIDWNTSCEPQMFNRNGHQNTLFVVPNNSSIYYDNGTFSPGPSYETDRWNMQQLTGPNLSAQVSYIDGGSDFHVDWLRP